MSRRFFLDDNPVGEPSGWYANPLRVADFVAAPGIRRANDGGLSGAEFLDAVLLPHYDEAEKRGEVLVVDMDGVLGYSAAFLKDAFGGLSRRRGGRAAGRVKIESKSPFRIRRAMDYMAAAANE